MERWRGKVAVVTGASSGIGASITKELLKHGVIVVGMARRIEKVEALKKEVDADKAKNLYAVKADVGKVEEVVNAFQWIKQNLKEVHILVNNAGMWTPTTLMDGSYESWKKTMDVNVLGLCTCTKEAIQLMKETGVDDGHIIHINSIQGHRVCSGDPSQPVQLNVYAASKHAVTALTETLRLELNYAKSKIKISSLSPGVTKTGIISANGPELPEGVFDVLPHLQPQDIADAAVYILGTPPNVQVHELVIKPLHEAL